MIKRTIVGTLTLLLVACGDGSESAAEPAASDKTVLVSQESPAVAVRPEQRTFRDWMAVCDNGQDCVAIGPSLEPATGWMRIGLAAGPEARPSLTMGFWPSETNVGQPPIILDIDGRTWPVTQSEDIDYPAGSIAAQDVPEVVATLAAARQVRVRAGTEILPVSANGVFAALLWIDERQGRLNTTTALIRRGPDPASRVPGAPALPRIATPKTVSQDADDPEPRLPAALEVLPDVITCRQETAFNPELQNDVQTGRLDATTRVWGVPCFIGAYNTGETWFLSDNEGQEPRKVSLPSAMSEPSDGTINGGFDPETRTITAFSKGRGLADCGSISTWVWSGTRFVLQSESEMTECWGLPADLWPTTWRTQ